MTDRSAGASRVTTRRAAPRRPAIIAPMTIAVATPPKRLSGPTLSTTTETRGPASGMGRSRSAASRGYRTAGATGRSSWPMLAVRPSARPWRRKWRSGFIPARATSSWTAR